MKGKLQLAGGMILDESDIVGLKYFHVLKQTDRPYMFSFISLILLLVLAIPLVSTERPNRTESVFFRPMNVYFNPMSDN